MLCVAPHSRPYSSDTLDIKNVPKSTNGITKVEGSSSNPNFEPYQHPFFFFLNENAYEKENYGAQNY